MFFDLLDKTCLPSWLKSRILGSQWNRQLGMLKDRYGIHSFFLEARITVTLGNNSELEQLSTQFMIKL